MPQRTGDLVLISKLCARSGRMAPFYFPVKNARNERPLFHHFMMVTKVLAEGKRLRLAMASQESIIGV